METNERDELEAGWEIFEIGVLRHDTWIEMGMTQEQLAKKAGKTKAFRGGREQSDCIKKSYSKGIRYSKSWKF